MTSQGLTTTHIQMSHHEYIVVLDTRNSLGPIIKNTGFFFIETKYMILFFSLKSQSVFSRDTWECLLFIGSLLVCLLAASATNNRIAPSKPCVCCQREMLLEKLARKRSAGTQAQTASSRSLRHVLGQFPGAPRE